MFLLIVVVLMTGADEPTVTHKVTPTEAICYQAADMVNENLQKVDTTFYIIACKPMEGDAL